MTPPTQFPPGTRVLITKPIPNVYQPLDAWWVGQLGTVVIPERVLGVYASGIERADENDNVPE